MPILYLKESAQLSFAGSDGIFIVDGTVAWKKSEDTPPVDIARIMHEKEHIVFAWNIGVPEKAVTAITNSILQINEGAFQSFVALREPVVGNPLVLDLKKPISRVICNCENLPPAEDIYFDFSGASSLPKHVASGSDFHTLKVREESLLRYSTQDPIKTRLAIRKRGNVVMVEITSAYLLPSGDEEVLAIPRGAKKRKEIENLIMSAENATEALPGLRTYRSRAFSELSSAESMKTSYVANGVLINDPSLVGRKNLRIRNANREIAATEENIERAEYLIKNKGAFLRELESLNRISEFAQRLINIENYSYRFYTTSGEHQIDLVVSVANE